MRLRHIIVSLGILTAVLFAAAPADAWGGRTHRKITSDAYFIMPAAFRAFLGATGTGSSAKNPALKPILQASVEPDTVLKDFRNHVFHIHGSDMGNGPFKVEQLANEIVDDIKNKKSRATIIQKLGWLSHYIADLVQPLHTGIVVIDGIEEKPYHVASERDADKSVHLYGVSFEGCRKIERLSALIVYWSLWANKYYDAMIEYYTPGNLNLKQGRAIVASCYSRAVNNIVLMWYTIWARAGGKINPKTDARPKYYPPYGDKKEIALPHSTAEIDDPDEEAAPAPVSE